MQETDNDAVDVFRLKMSCGGTHGIFVKRDVLRAVCKRALRHVDPKTPFNQRGGVVEVHVIHGRPRLASQFQKIAEALGM